MANVLTPLKNFQELQKLTLSRLKEELFLRLMAELEGNRKPGLCFIFIVGDVFLCSMILVQVPVQTTVVLHSWAPGLYLSS